jgi:hypothetical protein
MKCFYSVLAKICIGIVLCIFITGTASAIVILDVTGIGNNAGDATPQFNERTAAAISFSLTEDYTNVGFQLQFRCFTCDVSFYLTKDSIGPGTTPFGNLVALTTGVTDIRDPIFPDLRDLEAGDYFVTAIVNTFGFIWFASSNPNVTELPGTRDGNDFYTTNGDRTFAPRSDFDNFADGDFHYQLTADQLPPVSVPVPASGLLLFIGLLGLLKNNIVLVVFKK